jgi:hypothetical protein
MHGSIIAGLKKYVDKKMGAGKWQMLLHEAGLDSKSYFPIQAYPDEDVVAIVRAASAQTGLSVPRILEDFGSFLAADLIAMYPMLLREGWRTLDVIEHTEESIHTVVRARESGASPPRLSCTRIGQDRVQLVYDSPRKMCALAKGIAKGLAAHFRENILIEEPHCMHKGASQCELIISRIGS